MGTFRYRAVTCVHQSVTGAWWGSPGAPYTDAYIVSAVQESQPGSISDTIIASVASPGEAKLRFWGEYFLDGDSVFTPYNDLPVGFTITEARVMYQGSNFPFIGNELFLQFGALEESPSIICYGESPTGRFNLGSYTHPLDVNGDPPSALHLHTDGFGLRVTAVSPGGLAFGLCWLEIEGEYEIADPRYWQTTPTGETKFGPLEPDNTIIPPPIYTNPATGEFLFGPFPGIPWIPWTPLEPIIFVGIPLITPTKIVPVLLPQPIPVPWVDIPPPPEIEFVPVLPHLPFPDEDDDPGPIITSNPVQTDNGFTINVGGAATFVFIEDPSGIYTLIPGQLHDTLYDRTGLTPLDVKIPNPFVETGFMGQ